jgi:hypothetical protein
MKDIPAFPRPYSHDDYLEDIGYLHKTDDLARLLCGKGYASVN